jgi:hypothetical protein
MYYNIEQISIYKISAAHMTSAIEIPTRSIEGRTFIQLTKDHRMARLLCRDGHNRKDAFTCTLVMETIKECRDNVMRERVGARKGRKWTNHQSAKALVLEDTIHTITVPTIAGVEGKTFATVLEKPGSPVWIELTNDNLVYLADAVAKERELGEVRNKRQNNVSMLQVAKGSKIDQVHTGKLAGYIRARRETGASNTKRTSFESMYIPIGDDADKALELAGRYQSHEPLTPKKRKTRRTNTVEGNSTIECVNQSPAASGAAIECDIAAGESTPIDTVASTPISHNDGLHDESDGPTDESVDETECAMN